MEGKVEKAVDNGENRAPLQVARMAQPHQFTLETNFLVAEF